MSDWRKYIDDIGIKAATEALGRRVEPCEYMAVHMAVEALVSAIVLVPSSSGEVSSRVITTVQNPVYDSSEVADVDSVGITTVEVFGD